MVNEKELGTVIELHQRYLRGEAGGVCADLSNKLIKDVDLSGINLSRANLEEAALINVRMVKSKLNGANLRNATIFNSDFTDAYMSYANLICAKFRGTSLALADLSFSDMRYAVFINTDFFHADICGVNMYGSNLRSAYNVHSVKTNATTLFYNLLCPEEGSFVGWKKCKSDTIVKLLITDNAKRSSATTRKCRCSEAVVLDIQHLDGSKYESNYTHSMSDPFFVYRIGKTVKVEDFCENRWNECSEGIHFFITRDEAVNYR